MVYGSDGGGSTSHKALTIESKQTKLVGESSHRDFVVSNSLVLVLHTREAKQMSCCLLETFLSQSVSLRKVGDLFVFAIRSSSANSWKLKAQGLFHLKGLEPCLAIVENP